MSECCRCGDLLQYNLAQMPCCSGHIHTDCMIQHMMATVPSIGVSRCPICNEALGVTPDVQAPAVYYYDSPSEAASVTQAEQALNVRLTDPAFRAGVRAVRSKIRAAQRAVGAMNRRLTARAQEFRTTVAPHVAAIRDAAREARAESRLFPEVREATKARATALRAITLFTKREHMNYWDRRQLFSMPWGRRRSRYYRDPARRRFWIGI